LFIHKDARDGKLFQGKSPNICQGSQRRPVDFAGMAVDGAAAAVYNPLRKVRLNVNALSLLRLRTREARMAERSLIILKPDAVMRHLLGQIISRFEAKGLQIVGCKFMRISRDLAERHYGVHKGKDFYQRLLNYVCSGPVMVMVLQAEGVIEIVRRMMGATFGWQAEPGTIRGDWGCSQGYNLVHGSDSPESAADEIKLFFEDNELIDYELADAKWLYGKN